jgi:FkbM family methyltransferase
MEVESELSQNTDISNIRKFLNLFLQKFDIALMRYKTYSTLADDNKHLHRLMQLDVQQMSKEFVMFIMNNCKSSSSQLYQDLFVLYVTNKYYEAANPNDPFVFVEFGACDGILFSNSLLLEKNNWIGVIAEPAKKWHKELFENRSCIISTKAVSAVSGEELLFLETKDTEFSSLSKNSQNDNFANYRLSNTTRSYKVESISLNDLITESGIKQQVTYLSIDTEGGELEILQTFDFEKWSPAIITVEHNFSGVASRINDFLATKGYIAVLESMSKFESWFIHVDQIRIPRSNFLL